MRLLCIFVATGLFFSTAHLGAFDSKSDFVAAYQAYEKAIERGNTHLARDMAEKAYTYGKQVYGDDHVTTAILTLNYSRQLLPGAKDIDALKNALRIYEKEYGKEAADLIDILMELGAATAEFHDRSTSKHYHNRALDLAAAHFGDQSMAYAGLCLEIGQILLTDVNSTYAYRYLETARDIFEGMDDSTAVAHLGQTYFWLGKYKLARHQNKTATGYLLQSLEILEKLAPESPLTMTNHAFLIEAYERRGMRDAATKHCLAIGKAKPFREDQDYIPVYRKSPAYPVAAQYTNREGYAILELTVDRQGFVRNPIVVEYDGSPSFGEAGLETVKEFRYIPRFENGTAVDTHGVRYKFTFELAN